MMSILASNDDGWIISHEEFISKVYKGKYRLRPSLFNISRPYKIEKKKKRDHIDSLASSLKEKHSTLIKNLGASLKRSSLDHGESDAVDFAENISKVTTPLRNVNFSGGGNVSTDIIIHKINSCDVIFPEKCCFLGGDIKEKIKDIVDEFHLIVLDPPWWNKYIRRKKAKNPDDGYTMLYNEDIANLPIGNMTCSGTIIAVWCTNSKTHELSIKNDMFPSWGVTYTATWYWIKVTTDGDPICPFTKTNGKQPFERVILGVKDAIADQLLPEDEKIFVSIPSALHSHKPPLNDLLAPFLTTTSPKCLELFARYLLPDTTSVGLEPLRWQHIDLYYSINNDKEEDIHQDS